MKTKNKQGKLMTKKVKTKSKITKSTTTKTINRDKVARAYFYTKLGWSNYLAPWLGAAAYITIIYELVLKNYLQSSDWLYFAIFAIILIISFALGYLMKKTKIFNQEHAINTETNPYLNKIIGQKEILSWKSSIEGLKATIQFYKKQHINTKGLEIVLNEQQQLLKQAEKGA